MPDERPHFSASNAELQKLFAANKHDPRTLLVLVAELKHRSTPTARALLKEVEKALDAAKSTAEQDTVLKRASHETALPPHPPSHHVLTCRHCGAALRVPVRSGCIAYGCPTCKSDFEIVFKDGVLQTVWINAKPPAKDLSVTMGVVA